MWDGGDEREIRDGVYVGRGEAEGGEGEMGEELAMGR